MLVSLTWAGRATRRLAVAPPERTPSARLRAGDERERRDAAGQRCSRAVDRGGELVLEALAAEAQRVGADRGRVPPAGGELEALHRLHQTLDALRFEEQAGLAGEHRLQRAAAAERDHRRARRLRLDDRDAEVLDRRVDERP